jgi:hypothetical protein
VFRGEFPEFRDVGGGADEAHGDEVHAFSHAENDGILPDQPARGGKRGRDGFFEGDPERPEVYPTGIGFPVFPVTYSDIFHFFLRSLIPDKLPKEEK